jgi:hypothetical protein
MGVGSNLNNSFTKVPDFFGYLFAFFCEVVHFCIDTFIGTTRGITMHPLFNPFFNPFIPVASDIMRKTYEYYMHYYLLSFYPHLFLWYFWNNDKNRHKE